MNLQGLNNAWLSPSGEITVYANDFFSDGVAWHENLALCLLRDIWGLEDKFIEVI